MSQSLSGASSGGVPGFPPGWYPDPVHGHPVVRYWDGRVWTSHSMVPAVSVRPPKPPFRTLPLAVALGALVSIAVPLVASRFILRALSDLEWPIAVYVALLAVIAYGPPLLFWRYSIRRWGTGAFRADVGFSTRRTDFGWGPITWLCCFGTQMFLGVLVLVTHIPFTGNVENVTRAEGNNSYIIPMVIVAVVVAPFVEEILFRGLVLRGLLSVTHPVVAIAAQALLFGSAHFDPDRGMGNIGLILILSGVGAALGTAAYLFRRLGPTIVAHAIINGIAMTIALVR